MDSKLEKINISQESIQKFIKLQDLALNDSEHYNCPICRDSSWILTATGARPCDCRKQDMLNQSRRQMGLKPAMDNMRFNNFNLSYYAPDRLVDGQSYRKLAELALRSAKSFVAAYMHNDIKQGLFFEGHLGSGKTFLAAAIANELIEHKKPVLFIVVPEFLEQLRFSYREQNDDYDEAQIMLNAMQAPVLFLDDLGAHNSSAWTISKLYTLLNHRLNLNLPTIITSNLQPKALGLELGQRTASRIKEMCRRHLLLVEEDIRLRAHGQNSGW